MSDIKELLSKILTDEKLLGSKAFREKIYTDIPILQRASQLRRPATPQKIKDMKAMALTPEAYWKTSAWLFCTQGRFMADYTDDQPFGDDFCKVYPTYRDFTTEQLRGYFTWRTDVRKGVINKAPAPYPFLYVYELLNGIGAEHGAVNFRRIDNFCLEYSKCDDVLSSYREKWLCDYAVFHELDPSLLDDIGDSANEKEILILMNWEEHAKDEIYDAVCSMSSYRPEQSRYVQDNPDIFKAVLYKSFVLMSCFFRDKRKNSFCTKLFGTITETSYRLFDTAVFYDSTPLRTREYKVNDIRSYICRNGKWSCKRLAGSRHRSAKLGDLVKAVDSVLRSETGYPHKLGNTEISKQELSIIRSVISEYTSEQRKKEAVKIEIDISKLSSIRKAADITRDKLIVEEESDDEPIVDESTEVADMSLNNNNALLIKAESEFLSALLSGGDCNSVARDHGTMTSILADSINEKLFDTFGDTVLIFDGDTPEIIEDYLEELKDIIGK